MARILGIRGPKFIHFAGSEVRFLRTLSASVQRPHSEPDKMRLRLVAAACALLSAVVAEPNITSAWASQQILQGDFKPPPVFENKNLVRTTNLEKGYVRETINILIANVGKQPQTQYYLPFEFDVIGKVGGIEVRDKKNEAKGLFEVTTAAMPAVVNEDGTPSTYVLPECLSERF